MPDAQKDQDHAGDPRAIVREVHREARAEGADLYPVDDLINGASGFNSTPEDMTGALHRAGLLKPGQKTTRAAAEEALRLWRTTPLVEE